MMIAAPLAARWRMEFLRVLIPAGSNPVSGSSNRIAFGSCT